MARKFIGAWEPVFNGKHINDMTDEEIEEFSSWLVEQIAEKLDEDE